MLVADARLDERGNLSTALGMSSAEFARCTDADLILRAYLTWGTECPRRLVGDFAFALWDQPNRTLFCARDHAGTRPFYYSDTGGRFAFAGTTDGVLAVPGASHELDVSFVRSYLEGSLVRAPERTFFRHVRRLPAAHTLTRRGDQTRLSRFWSIDQASEVRFRRDADYIDAARELHRQAVRDRIADADRVGVHVSGGLDCSGIAAVAAEECRNAERAPPVGYTWFPPVDAFGRTPDHDLVTAVAERAGLDIVHLLLTPDDVVRELVRDGARAMIATGTLMHESIVQAHAARNGVRVILSGHGGDEGLSFNGRGYLPELLTGGRFQALRAECRARGRPWRTLFNEALLPIAGIGAARAVARLTGRRRRRQRPPLLRADVAAKVPPLPKDMPRMTSVPGVLKSLHENGFLSDRMDEWAASAAARGLVYRYPLLDRRVLEFVAGVPHDLFRRDGQRRWLMRTAMGSILPPEVCANTRIDDTARVAALNGAIAGALPRIAGMVRARQGQMERAAYVDVERLLAEMDPEAYRSDPRPLRLVKALQFLDFA